MDTHPNIRLLTIVESERLTALRDRLVKAVKLLKTPFSDPQGWVDKKMLNSEKFLCSTSINALKEDRKAVDMTIKTLIDTDPQLKNFLISLIQLKEVDLLSQQRCLLQLMSSRTLVTTGK